MIILVQAFKYCLLGSKVFFHVDHDALKYMVNKPQLSGCMVCWVLLLQKFDFTIEVQPGKNHAKLIATVVNANIVTGFALAHTIVCEGGKLRFLAFYNETLWL